MPIPRLMLVTPAYRRFDLTRIMLEHRKETLRQAAELGVECQCVVIADDSNLAVAESLGFHSIEAPNVLGRKYNDGHEYAVEAGWDYSLQCNTDQVFDPALLAAIAQSPKDKFIRTRWLTFVHSSGKKSLSMRNQVWALTAYPTDLLRNNPRPCDELATRMCDSSVHRGVAAANPEADTHTIELHPLEAVQFESGFQLTPWKKNLMVALADGVLESPVPWHDITRTYGKDLTDRMVKFYGLPVLRHA